MDWDWEEVLVSLPVSFKLLETKSVKGAIAAGGLLGAFVNSRKRHGVVLDEEAVRSVRDARGGVEYAVRDAREAVSQ
jgi:hypothetical protein